MTQLPTVAILLWLATPAPIPSVPPPPDGTYEAEITRVVADRVKAELKGLLDQLERDASTPPATKREIKGKVARMKVAVYSTPGRFDEVVAFYEGGPLKPFFLKGDRDVLADAKEAAQAAGVTLSEDAEKQWKGVGGRRALWQRPDGGVEIAIEDHLIDPRNGKVTRKTVVLVTSVVD